MNFILYNVLGIMCFCLFFNLITLNGEKEKTWIDVVGIPLGLSMLLMSWLYLGIFTYVKREYGHINIYTRYRNNIFGDRLLFGISTLLKINLVSFFLIFTISAMIISFNFIEINHWVKIGGWSVIVSMGVLGYLNLCLFVPYKSQ